MEFESQTNFQQFSHITPNRYYITIGLMWLEAFGLLYFRKRPSAEWAFWRRPFSFAA